MKKLYQKYSLVGFATLIPLGLLSYGSYIIFPEFYRNSRNDHGRLMEDFTWSNPLFLEFILAWGFFIFLFLILLLGYISSFIYISGIIQQNEKRMRMAHGMRIFCWGIAIILFLLYIAILSFQLNRTF